MMQLKRQHERISVDEERSIRSDVGSIPLMLFHEMRDKCGATILYVVGCLSTEIVIVARNV
jgi:hypothetical protein